MEKLSSNRDLYDYLLFLASELKERGSVELSEAVRAASGHASGISTEFLGESRLALRRVFNAKNSILSDEYLADMTEVLKQLDAALDKQ
jgi:hypothetical protein